MWQTLEFTHYDISEIAFVCPECGYTRRHNFEADPERDQAVRTSSICPGRNCDGDWSAWRQLIVAYSELRQDRRAGVYFKAKFAHKPFFERS